MTMPPIVPGPPASAPPYQYSGVPYYYAPLPPKKKPIWPWIAGGAAVLVLLAAGSVVAVLLLVSRGSGESPLPAVGPLAPAPLLAASGKCNAGELADNDRTLFLDMKGTDPGTGTGTVDDLSCILRQLDAPSYVRTQMGQTRALDGRQEAEWGDFKASWTYHPDNGLDVLIRDVG